MSRPKRIALGVVIVATLALMTAARAPAQDDRPPTVEQMLILSLAQVCVNEAGFTSLPDCAMIWQAAERFPDNEQSLAWLRRHSRRVLGDRPCRRGNCRWSRNLTDTDARPAGWPSGVRWPVRGWRRVRRWSYRLVHGLEPLRPCRGRVITWGGDMDTAGALRRGLRRLECTGTRNTGWARR